MKLLCAVSAAALLLVSVACKVEKTGDDTYKVQAPTAEAKAAAEKAKQDAAAAGDVIKKDAKEVGQTVQQTAHDIGQTEAAQDIKEGAKKIGSGVKKGAGEAAQATGTALQKAGKKMKDAPRPEVTTTVKTETGTKTTTYQR